MDGAGGRSKVKQGDKAISGSVAKTTVGEVTT